VRALSDPSLALAILCGVALACAHAGPAGDPEAAARRRAEGAALVARDDARSLEGAAALFAEAARLDPAGRAAPADRALALSLLASERAEEATALQARVEALEEERQHLALERAPAWEDRQAAVAARIRSLSQEVQELRRQAATLRTAAGAILSALGPDGPDELASTRAMAVAAALEGRATEAEILAERKRAAARVDAWLDLVGSAADAMPPSAHGRRFRAAKQLRAVAAAHPELLRARVLLAEAQSDLGEREAALESLDGVLAANPAHEGAQRLKAELLAPPAPHPIPYAVPQNAPPPRPAGTLPRKASRSSAAKRAP
jgi:hypothetical protein